MIIQNRSNEKIFWRAFNKSDGIRLFGLTEGNINAGSQANPSLSGNVQIEIRKPTMGKLLVAAKTSKAYSSSTTLLFTPNHKLIDMNGDISKYLNHKSIRNGSKKGSFDAISGIVGLGNNTLAALGTAFTIAGKGVGVFGGGAGGLAAFILAAFSGNDESLPPPLTQDQIKSAVKDALEEHDVQEHAENILWGWHAFEHFIWLSEGYSAQGRDFENDDMIDFLEFIEANDNGLTPFLPAMNALSGNRDMRFLALPEWVSGIAMSLQLKRMRLAEKAGRTELIAEDYSDIINTVERYLERIDESRFDFEKKGRELIEKYDLWSIDQYRNELLEGIVEYYMDGNPRLLEDTRMNLLTMRSGLQLMQSKLRVVN